jgi:hypothetical protein
MLKATIIQYNISTSHANRNVILKRNASLHVAVVVDGLSVATTGSAPATGNNGC